MILLQLFYFFWTPRYGGWSKKAYVCGGRCTIIKIVRPISIGVCSKIKTRIIFYVDSMEDCLLQVEDESLCNCPMSYDGFVHKLWKFIYWKINIWTSERQILETSKYTLKLDTIKRCCTTTNFRVVIVDSRVKTSLAPILLILDRSSRIYLFCEMNRPYLIEMTSIPKKKYNWPMSLKKIELQVVQWYETQSSYHYQQ